MEPEEGWKDLSNEENQINANENGGTCNTREYNINAYKISVGKTE
jgi:hypothetical protein